jgi:DNA polymerase-3 subunit epsilon
MSTKQLFIDLETTGADPAKHGVRQIAFLVYVDGVWVESFNFDVRPLPTDEIDRNGMISMGVDIDKMMEFETAEAVKTYLDQVLSKYVEKYDRNDKFYLLGYNVRFDEDFLRQWFLKLGDKFFGSYFWTPAIDVMGLAADVVMKHGSRSKMDNFKLATVCKIFGVKLDNADDALSDIRATNELYRKLNAPTIIVGGLP